MGSSAWGSCFDVELDDRVIALVVGESGRENAVIGDFIAARGTIIKHGGAVPGSVAGGVVEAVDQGGEGGVGDPGGDADGIA